MSYAATTSPKRTVLEVPSVTSPIFLWMMKRNGPMYLSTFALSAVVVIATAKSAASTGVAEVVGDEKIRSNWTRHEGASGTPH